MVLIFSSVSKDTETTLLCVWSHSFFTKPTDPDPPTSHKTVQSDAVPDGGSPLQQDKEQVKVEAVGAVEELAAIGLTEQEASSQSSDTPEDLDR